MRGGEAGGHRLELEGDRGRGRAGFVREDLADQAVQLFVRVGNGRKAVAAVLRRQGGGLRGGPGQLALEMQGRGRGHGEGVDRRRYGKQKASPTEAIMRMDAHFAGATRRGSLWFRGLGP